MLSWARIPWSTFFVIFSQEIKEELLSKRQKFEMKIMSIQLSIAVEVSIFLPPLLELPTLYNLVRHKSSFVWVIAQQLSRRAQIWTEICIKLFTRRRIKRRDRRRSFSISLNFHQAILESSPQTRFMFDVKKLLFINALTFLPGEAQDDLLRIAIDLPEFRSNSQTMQVTSLVTAKKKVQHDLQRCVTPPTQFVIVSLCCLSLRHEINLLRRSFS